LSLTTYFLFIPISSLLAEIIGLKQLMINVPEY